MAKANCRPAEAEALAAPLAGEIKPQPGPSESATAAPTPPADPTGDDQSGLYRGQICYGSTEALSAHCFKAQAVITRFKISGQWPAATPGSTMYLAGGISRAGDVAIHMHAQRADGSRGPVADMFGKLHDGRIVISPLHVSARCAELRLGDPRRHIGIGGG